MKKSILLITAALLTVLLCSLGLSAANAKAIGVLVPDGNGAEIELSPVDGVFYLPSASDITKVKFSFEGTLSYEAETISGTLKKGETLDLSSCKAKDERGEDCYRLSLENKTYTFYRDDRLSSVFVATSKGLSAIDGDKENRDKHSRIVMLNGDGSVEYSDLTADTESEIKSRGNATWTYYKKAYQIKLAKKTDLWDMGKAKTWILLANYTDQSSLHNALGFMLGDAVNVPYNIDYRFVNLYVDGEYRGLYMLCEKVQIDENRVNIADLEGATEDVNPDRDLADAPIRSVTSGPLVSGTALRSYTYCDGIASPGDVTGGYLVELDFRGEQEPCHFITDNGNIYVVKSPEYASKAEMEYIAGLFADMEEAIYSETGYNRKGVHYSEYIDMESFAGVYTVQELMKNWDAYLGSMFFFKDADEGGETAKIYMGPLWDLDNTLGNINYNYEFGQDTAYLWAQNGVFQDYVRGFAKNLMRHADFQGEVAESYALAYSAVQSVLAENGWLSQSVEEIRAGIAMDRTRWALYDNDSWLRHQNGHKITNVKFVHFEEYGTPEDDTKTTALGFLRYYLSSRADALLQSIGKAPVTPPPVGGEATAPGTKPSESTSAESRPSDPTPPQTEPPEAPSENGHENCTARGFAKFWNAVVNFFRRLFGKPEICVCGKEK